MKQKLVILAALAVLPIMAPTQAQAESFGIYYSDGYKAPVYKKHHYKKHHYKKKHHAPKVAYKKPKYKTHNPYSAAAKYKRSAAYKNKAAYQRALARSAYYNGYTQYCPY